MRATKNMFLEVINNLSNLVGEPLYLFHDNEKMYISPITNCEKNPPQNNYYICMPYVFSMENYNRLLAYEAGYAAALRRMQCN